jgi:hypothetical protein
MAAQTPVWLAAILKALRRHGNDIAREPLPRRWVHLIHNLEEEERRRAQAAPDSPRGRHGAIGYGKRH